MDIYIERERDGYIDRESESEWEREREREWEREWEREGREREREKERETGLEKSFLCQSQKCLGCHFSGRIFFLLGRNRAPRLKSLGAKKRSYLWDLLHTPGHKHHQWNDSKLLFFWQWKSIKKKKKKEKKRKRNYQKEVGPTSFSWNPERKG